MLKFLVVERNRTARPDTLIVFPCDFRVLSVTTRLSRMNRITDKRLGSVVSILRLISSFIDVYCNQENK